MSRPPIVGPKMGARIIARPTTLMTRPKRCGPAARVRTIWPTGMIMPPPMPCRTRKAMSDSVDQARPQSTEPSVNRTTEAIHRRLAPNLPAAQPETGMTAASASM
jgi:hypothetical protein